MVGSPNEDADCIAAQASGKSFLLELLDSVVVDYYYYQLMLRNKFHAKLEVAFSTILFQTDMLCMLYLGFGYYEVLFLLILYKSFFHCQF